MAFQFPLATVLRVRVIREEREERMLQQILHRIVLTLHAIEDIDAQTAQANSHRVSHLRAQVPGRQVHEAYGEVNYLREQRKELEAQMEQLEQLREKQFATYQAARRDREMLTDMHDRQHVLYSSDASRREQKTLDDNFNARSFRANRQQ